MAKICRRDRYANLSDVDAAATGANKRVVDLHGTRGKLQKPNCRWECNEAVKQAGGKLNSSLRPHSCINTELPGSSPFAPILGMSTSEPGFQQRFCFASYAELKGIRRADSASHEDAKFRADHVQLRTPILLIISSQPQVTIYKRLTHEMPCEDPRTSTCQSCDYSDRFTKHLAYSAVAEAPKSTHEMH